MQGSQWIERLLTSTRGQVISLLRRSGRTVNELAAELGLTDNAVRSHLAALERDGLVHQHPGSATGVGKPAYRYTLTAEADALLPKAYAPVLEVLLGTLAEKMNREDYVELLREVGRKAGRGKAGATDDIRLRIDAAYGFLGELGGVADIEEGEHGVVVRGFSCPLAALVPHQPEVCKLAESLLTEIVGAPVLEHCDKSTPPRCRFEIAMREPGRDLAG